MNRKNILKGDLENENILGSDGKFKGYSQNFNVEFGIAYILGMVLLAVALYFLPIVAGVVCLISLGAGKDYSLCSVICFILTLISLPIYWFWIWS